MALSIPKIKLGISKDKSFFDLTHDVNTTSDFGFCQPTLFHPVIPNTHVRLKTSSFVRLAPMPQPSFARVQLRSYDKFIPMRDVFMAFDFLQSQQAVTSALKTYIPTSADYMTMGEIISFVLNCCNLYSFDKNTKPLALTTFHVIPNDDTDEFYMLNDSEVITEFDRLSLRDSYYFTSLDLVHHTTYSDDSDALLQRYLQWCYREVTAGEYHGVGYSYISPSLESADFIYMTKAMVTDRQGVRQLKDCACVINLTHEGKRLFKVLYGLGVQFGYPNTKFPLYNLLAYYKAWFDTFSPQRDLQWKVTPAFKLIHSYYDTNTRSVSFSSDEYGVTSALVDFFCSLPYCCYSLDIDPITVCQPKPVMNDFGNQGRINYVFSDESSDTAYMSSAYGDYPTISSVDESGSIGVRWLQKLLPFVNKNSVIGRRVHEYMRTHFGSSHDRIDYTFGTDINPLEISDVLNMTAPLAGEAGANMEELGALGGKGQGYSAGNSHSFDAQEHGFILQFVCIVPFGGYSQQVGPSLAVERFDFFQREFDSLGMDAVGYDQVMSACDVSNEMDNRETPTFGFRPRYFNYKYKNNLRNGDFKFRGSRAVLMPYCLDRYFTEPDVVLERVGTQPYGEQFRYRMRTVTPSYLPCNEALRFIGQSEDFGNYDRLFVDQYGVEDNFIIHMVHDFKLNSPMLPISESFDTFDNEGLKDDNHSTAIQHS